jgi:hypothetical protein
VLRAVTTIVAAVCDLARRHSEELHELTCETQLRFRKRFGINRIAIAACSQLPC